MVIPGLFWDGLRLRIVIWNLLILEFLFIKVITFKHVLVLVFVLWLWLRALDIHLRFDLEALLLVVLHPITSALVRLFRRNLLERRVSAQCTLEWVVGCRLENRIWLGAYLSGIYIANTCDCFKLRATFKGKIGHGIVRSYLFRTDDQYVELARFMINTDVDIISKLSGDMFAYQCIVWFCTGLVY